MKNKNIATFHSEEKVSTKRRYEKPEVLESAMFETLALACGKISGLSCVQNGGLGAS